MVETDRDAVWPVVNLGQDHIVLNGTDEIAKSYGARKRTSAVLYMYFVEGTK